MRITTKLLAVLHILHRYPRQDVLVMHGPLVYLMQQYAGHVPFTDEDVYLFRRNYGLEQRLKEQLQAEALRIYLQMTELWWAPSWVGSLDDTALTMCNSFIAIMLLVNPADQRFVEAVIETVGEEEPKFLPDLDRGEALISGQCVQFPVMARIKPPHSRGKKQEKDLIRLVMEEE